MRDIEPASPAPPGRSSSDAGFSQSLERGLAILSAFKPGRPLLGSSELAREIGLSRSTAHRYVASLAMLGYLQQDPLTRKYRLGPRVLDLGFSAINSMEIREISAPYLQQLSDETGHTVNMAILDGEDIVYVERCRSSRQGQRDIDLNLHVGSRLPAYCTSMGKVLLAYLPDEEQTALLDRIELVAARPEHAHGAPLAARRARARARSRARDQQRGTGLRPALDRRAGALAQRRGGGCHQSRRAPFDGLDGGSRGAPQPGRQAHRRAHLRAHRLPPGALGCLAQHGSRGRGGPAAARSRVAQRRRHPADVRVA